MEPQNKKDEIKKPVLTFNIDLASALLLGDIIASWIKTQKLSRIGMPKTSHQHFAEKIIQMLAQGSQKLIAEQQKKSPILSTKGVPLEAKSAQKNNSE